MTSLWKSRDFRIAHKLELECKPESVFLVRRSRVKCLEMCTCNRTCSMRQCIIGQSDEHHTSVTSHDFPSVALDVVLYGDWLIFTFWSTSHKMFLLMSRLLIAVYQLFEVIRTQGCRSREWTGSDSRPRTGVIRHDTRFRRVVVVVVFGFFVWCTIPRISYRNIHPYHQTVLQVSRPYNSIDRLRDTIFSKISIFIIVKFNQ